MSANARYDVDKATVVKTPLLSKDDFPDKQVWYVEGLPGAGKTTAITMFSKINKDFSCSCEADNSYCQMGRCTPLSDVNKGLTSGVAFQYLTYGLSKPRLRMTLHVAERCPYLYMDVFSPDSSKADRFQHRSFVHCGEPDKRHVIYLKASSDTLRARRMERGRKEDEQMTSVQDKEMIERLESALENSSALFTSISIIFVDGMSKDEVLNAIDTAIALSSDTHLQTYKPTINHFSFRGARIDVKKMF